MKILLRNHHSNMKGSSHLLSSPTAAGDSRHVGDVWTHTGAIGDARTKWQKEARNQDVSNHPTLQVLTNANTNALTPSFSGGPRSVQEHRRYANSPSGRATCRVARMPKSFNRSPPLGRQLQTPPVSSKAQQRTAGVRRATDSPTERRARGRRAQRAGMRLGNHLDSTKCVGLRSVGCSCRPPHPSRN